MMMGGELVWGTRVWRSCVVSVGESVRDSRHVREDVSLCRALTQ